MLKQKEVLVMLYYIYKNWYQFYFSADILWLPKTIGPMLGYTTDI